ncbi:hypothetical protein KQX54_007734 [Cotesia glomerata]|uniref:Uncharacterized protein n=1 Tax=Cotesia glomerata TaxID=32391 RepID=A0AAV7IGI9_COTGL|nr:hypothetical protein KQX54_007734 [Cotesia glomerata]
MIYSSEDIRNLFINLENEEIGIVERKPRWLECIGEIELTDAAAYAFTKKYFSKDSEQKARSMLAAIHESLQIMIEKSNLMTGELKEDILRKLKKMKIFIGFLQWYKNQTHVDNIFKGLNIGDCYMDNILSYRKFELKVGLTNMLNLASTYEGWDVDPINVNARYQNNIISVPVANLQPPLFTFNLPEPVNYGISGGIIGHEMSHGFDSEGLLIDENQEKRKLPDVVIEVINARMECFATQFDKIYTDKIGNITADQQEVKRL